MNNNSFTPKIFDNLAIYTIKVGEPDTNNWQTKKNVSPDKTPITFKFNK